MPVNVFERVYLITLQALKLNIKIMEENIKKLQKIFSLTKLKPHMFYSIEICSNRINLQGRDTIELRKILFKYNESLIVNKDSSFLNFNKHNIYIVLT